MKPSHYTTPRTMADAVWQPWADPLDFPARRPRYQWHDYAMALFLAGVALAIYLGVI